MILEVTIFNLVLIEITNNSGIYSSNLKSAIFKAAGRKLLASPP